MELSILATPWKSVNIWECCGKYLMKMTGKKLGRWNIREIVAKAGIIESGASFRSETAGNVRESCKKLRGNR